MTSLKVWLLMVSFSSQFGLELGMSYKYFCEKQLFVLGFAKF